MLIMPLNNSCSEITFVKISQEISKQQLEQGIRSGDKDYFHEIRIKLSELGKLNFYNSSCDTLFLLESYDIENANFYGKIWNNEGFVAYTYNNGNFNFDKVGAYTQYTCKLIQDWDIKKIRHEESTNSTMFNPLLIYGTRVIIQNGTIKVDSIQFKEFFLLERDR